MPKLATIGLLMMLGVVLSLSACSYSRASQEKPVFKCSEQQLLELDHDRVMRLAADMLENEPRTITADRAERSAGGKNDFYSEGDYWWPVANDPSAPYERRDGQSNPDNFVAHRLSMMRLADHIGVLVSAWKLTEEQEYADVANRHLKAWFVNPKTKMAPKLLYAQAIQGRHAGRSIGLIDTLHLVEVARGAKLLIEAEAIPNSDAKAIVSWFREYGRWMNSHPYGVKERDWYNNHSIAWSLQIAAFADLTGDEALMQLVRDKFKQVYLAEMMDESGAFPKEVARTKPYGYSLFVIDLMAGIASIASTENEDLWLIQTDNGRSMSLGVEFIFPYVANKNSWPYKQDIQYWREWPVRHPFLYLGGINLQRCDLLKIVKGLPDSSDVYEVRRNWPMRHPILWAE